MIDNDTIAKLVEQGGIVAPKGGPGSAIFFHGTPGARQPAQHVAVGPPDHLRDLQRRVSNAIRRFKRPAYIAHRDFTPIDAWEDDAVTRAARRKAGRGISRRLTGGNT